jgi:hypothetical protein
LSRNVPPCERLEWYRKKMGELSAAQDPARHLLREILQGLIEHTEKQCLRRKAGQYT